MIYIPIVCLGPKITGHFAMKNVDEAISAKLDIGLNGSKIMDLCPYLTGDNVGYSNKRSFLYLSNKMLYIKKFI